MSAVVARVGILGTLLLHTAGCGPDAALLIVEVSGLPSQVSSLRLSAQLSGQALAVPSQVEGSLDSFGLLLPPRSTGAFNLMADGLDSRGCTISHGMTDTTLTGGNRIRLSLPMVNLGMPLCPK